MASRKSGFLFLSMNLLLWASLASPAQRKGVDAITVDGLRAHLTFIAADETLGRDTPSTAINIVSRYLATVVERFGFTPIMPDRSFFQNVPLEITAVSSSMSRLRVISTAGEELFYCPESFGGIFRTPGNWSGDIVFVGYGLSAPEKGWDDYGDAELAGKVVLMLEGQLPEGHALRADRAALATRTSFPRNKGASLVLTVISPEREKELLDRHAALQLSPRAVLVGAPYPTQNQARVNAGAARGRGQQPALTQQPAGRPGPPPGAAELRHEAASKILGVSRAELEGMFVSVSAGRQVPRRVVNKRIELSIVTETHTDSSPNVLALLEGSDPVLKDEYVVISAHHDHLGVRNGRVLDGADDDGSGTAGMLEIAKALALEKPRRSVILAWFTGEEKGLFGSHYFVNHCPVPLEKISAVLNLDMISRNDPDSLFLIASNNLSTELDRSIRSQNDKYSRFKFDYVYNDRAHPDRFYYRSDQYPFVRVGVPGVWLFCGTTPDYHTPNDTIARVDFKKMEKVARLTYLVACDIGNQPALLKLDANPEVTTRGKHNTSVESIR